MWITPHLQSEEMLSDNENVNIEFEERLLVDLETDGGSRSSWTRWTRRSTGRRERPPEGTRRAAHERKPRRWPSGCAPSAERIGLIDRVLPRASFHDDWRSIARLLASRAAGEIKTVIRGATIAEAVSAFARLWRSDEHWSAADKVMKRGK